MACPIRFPTIIESRLYKCGKLPVMELRCKFNYRFHFFEVFRIGHTQGGEALAFVFGVFIKCDEIYHLSEAAANSYAIMQLNFGC
jgi:hypothetical protein